MLLEKNMTKVFAHRGYSMKYPENTLQAFKEALNMGVDGIELDVHLSRTNDLVVIHDETIDRTTISNGIIAEMTRTDIVALQTIPLLETVIKEIPIQTLNIELKTDINPYPGIEEHLLKMLNTLNPIQEIIVSSFNIDTLKRLREKDKNLALALIASQYVEEELEIFERLNLDAIHYEASVVLEEKTSLERSKIRVWTVNDHDEFYQLKELGVGVIMTDDASLSTHN